MKEKEFYRKQIIEIIKKINRIDILKYLCKIIMDINSEDT